MSGVDPVSGGIIGAVGVLVLACSKAFTRIFKTSSTALISTINSLEKDVARITAERNQAIMERNQERIAKHDALTKQTSAEWALELTLTDFRRFLMKENIDPGKFVPTSTTKVRDLWERKDG